jgi:thiamine-phosphate pyrophosphorylase
MSARQRLTQELVRLHAAMQTEHACTFEQALVSDEINLPDEQVAVRQACRMLGFVEEDVQLLDQAWQRQSQRTGHFDPHHWPDEPQDFDIEPWPRTKAFAPCPQSLGLYAVLPDAQWVARMAQAGVPTVQLRFKSTDMEAVRREVRAAVQAVKGSQSLLFINDHWQIAMEEGAYGVHLGQEDMDDAQLETVRHAGLRLGLSTHGYGELLRAQAVSPSYLALGAVFATTLKKMKTAPQGLGRLGAYARLMRGRSLVAIGGIDLSAVPDVMRTGVGSIAVVRAITAADQPEQAAQDFQRAMQSV